MLFPLPQYQKLKDRLVRGDIPQVLGVNDVKTRAPLDCPAKNSRYAVLHLVGQSQGANYQLDFQVPEKPVVNWNPHDGKCYRVAYPMLGPDGPYGSFWPRVADGLVAKGSYDGAVLAPIAVGGSALREWLPGGALHPRLLDALNRLLASGLTPTHIAWQQGETDAVNSPDGAAYLKGLGEVFRAIADVAPQAQIFVAVSTLCKNEGNESIREAQRRAVDLLPVIRSGPDTDVIDRAKDRYDGCHFSRDGSIQVADLWLKALLASHP